VTSLQVLEAGRLAVAAAAAAAAAARQRALYSRLLDLSSPGTPAGDERASPAQSAAGRQPTSTDRSCRSGAFCRVEPGPPTFHPYYRRLS